MGLKNSGVSAARHPPGIRLLSVNHPAEHYPAYKFPVCDYPAEYHPVASVSSQHDPAEHYSVSPIILLSLQFVGTRDLIPAMHWRKVTIVGVGLLGGSLGIALKARHLAERVVGVVRRKASLAECIACRAVDEAHLELEPAVQGADLVVLCTPIARMAELARQLQPLLNRGTLVTDVGSVKAILTKEVAPVITEAGAEYIGSHPMAGSEKSGVKEAREDLFANALCVITPTDQSSREGVGALEKLWRSVGGRPVSMPAEIHDQLVSRSSHLPHVVAAALASYVLDPQHPAEQAMLCANGFRDATRIASGSVEMWRDICLANRGPLDDSLRVFLEELAQFRQALQQGDEAAIEAFLARAKTRRDQWQNQSGPSSPE